MHGHETPALLQSKAYLNGKWCDAQSGATFPVTNPADGTTLTSVPDMDPQDAIEAVSAAHDAFPAWSRRTAGDRADRLRAWNDLILAHREDLARLMTLEQGKPLAESRGEVDYGASFVAWFAEEARRAYGDIIPSHASDKRILALRQPVGVVLAITPWNFPIAMITRKVAPALAAGCTVVVKPAAETPLCALALAWLAHEAGIPPGVLNVLTTARASDVGEAIMKDARVRKISFTGSTPVGKILMRQAADSVMRVSLELGGNAPFIVFDDADVEAAADGALASKYRNAGQTCVCANRIFVQDSVYDAFLEAYDRKVATLKVGNGLEDGVDIGPIINEKGVGKIERLLDDAVQSGARITRGGQRHAMGGTWFEPTIVQHVEDDMDMSNEEIFGPVSAVYRFADEDEAVRRANNTPFGLAAYFYAKDNARIWRVSEGLEYGMVGVNTGMVSTPVAPFGGVKESGIGREGSRHGMDEYLEIKYVCVGGL